MRYNKVHIEKPAYELPPVVVSSEELEERLGIAYDKLGLQRGQLELLTGIEERRFWEPGYPVSLGAAAAARNAIRASGIPSDQIEALVYGGVCRDHFEPATACHVAAELERSGFGLSRTAHMFDLSNACLGVLNGMLEVANRIELGQIRAGLVVACESARDIVEATISRLTRHPDPELFRMSLATLTGGSGAVAVVMTDGSFAENGSERHRLTGAVLVSEPEHHRLCIWGVEPESRDRRQPFRPPQRYRQFMATDAVAVLEHGVVLARETWRQFIEHLEWPVEEIDRFVCHQVGSRHREAVLSALGIDREKDYEAFPFLGNTGSVALPLALGLASERGFVEPGHKVGLLGIGSGLNCLMMGIEW